MRRTIDMQTGKPFRWNTTVVYATKDGRNIIVPARMGTRTATHLHPDRVPPSLLAALNPARSEHAEG